MDDLDSERDVELSSLEAIYPEIQRVHPDDPYTIALDVPVKPAKGAVNVFFPAAAETSTSNGVNGAGNNINGNAGVNAVESHELAHLPSLHLEIAFGPEYPAEQPPKITISTNPPWIPAETVKRLEDDGPRLWEEMGRDIVGFTYIDHIQQCADDVFGLVGEKGGLEVDPKHKIAILDYDITAKRASFERETFDCGVCLDPKKGSTCHRMMDCGHVFCIECLRDFYNTAIKEGDLAAVRCLAPDCAKNRLGAAARGGKKRKKPRTFISPSELLQIPLEPDVVKRYVTLKYKTELESDKNTIYCPRRWCNGAARSKKHKKPQGLELAEADDDDDEASGDDDDDDENDETAEGEVKTRKIKPYKAAEERLAICEECSFAFCSRCYQSWHGEFYNCAPRREKDELTAEEKASLEYMQLHTTPCPTCAAPAQKTHGCNHMICYRCQTHFCYLCSAWLDPGNPYQHFNETPNGQITGCYMRLWELENGDGDDVGLGFAGGVQPPAAAAARPVAAAGAAPLPLHDMLDEMLVLVPEIEEPEEVELDHAQARHHANQQQQQNGGGDRQIGIAREGPLVLRIAGNGNQPAGAGRGGPRNRGAGAPAPAAAAAVQARGAGPHNNHMPRGHQQHQQAIPAQAPAGRRGARIGGGGQGGGRLQGGGGGGGGRGHGNNNNRQNNNNNQAAAANQPPQQRRNHHQNNGGNGAGVQRVQAVQQRRVVQGLVDIAEDGGAWHVEVVDEDDGPEQGGGEVLDAAQEAWVRHFVQLALNDEEDSDDDGDDIHFLFLG
ncbi:RWD domain-containing protein [Diplogelasinospora grovesii]|uniref:RBR-type E3 ubiquitin transferase n=1 Tax=Diplogelasinospora grovesii TaxID=303347 RepID=A0AAN6N5B2_9PEZI|nr:RWD domain-containing protein [Diplogelasinospora grovesii]